MMNGTKIVQLLTAVIGVLTLVVICLPSDDEGFIAVKIFTVLMFLVLVGLLILIKAIDHNMEKQYGKEQWEEIQANAENILIEEERKQAIASQSMTEPWTVRFETHPCPHCGHYKVRSAKWDDKKLSVAFWGAASDKIGKEYICEHCKEMW